MIIDISQEITRCKVYPGDPIPNITKISSMEKGDLYNLSSIFMCAHNGTHVDAPSHFIKEGNTIDKIPLEYFVGECYVHSHNGEVNELDAIKIIEKAKLNNAKDRILIKGKVKGNVVAKSLVFVTSSGVLDGDITTKKVVLEPGCKFSGKCTMINE